MRRTFVLLALAAATVAGPVAAPASAEDFCYRVVTSGTVMPHADTRWWCTENVYPYGRYCEHRWVYAYPEAVVEVDWCWPLIF